MSERRFVIKEVDDREAIFHPYEIAINESELRQRAVLMFNAKWTCKEDIRIDILLHGEGEKDWNPRCNRGFQFDQPSPTPTREEWVEWATKLTSMVKFSEKWSGDEVFNHILSMPIIPKE